MRLKILLNVIGGLLVILGLTMILPIFISYFYEGNDLNTLF